MPEVWEDADGLISRVKAVDEVDRRAIGGSWGIAGPSIDLDMGCKTEVKVDEG
jgi:hypothetical protein